MTAVYVFPRNLPIAPGDACRLASGTLLFRVEAVELGPPARVLLANAGRAWVDPQSVGLVLVEAP